jgi:hypothetical protein
MRLNELVFEGTATWFFSARLYALIDFQRYSSVRRFPSQPSYTTHLLNAQLTYEVNRDFQIYAGVRAGSNPADLSLDPGRRTEVYFKITRTLHPFGRSRAT